METLPTELVEIVVGWLDFPDICALRLTGHTISSKTSTAVILRRLFSSRRLEMTQASLEQLVRFTQPGQVGLWLQRLTLYDWPEREQTGADLTATELLSQALENIRDRPSPHQDSYLSISLEINNDEDDRDIPARVFHVVISAIATTKIPIHGLEIFTEAYELVETNMGSLAFSDITLALSRHRENLATSLQNCRKFSLSLGHSTRGLVYESGVYRLPLTLDDARQNTQSLCDLLNMCPLLEELRLAWVYEDYFEETDASTEELEFFGPVGMSCNASAGELEPG
ncbi:uncharacterized protein BO97DRAFT_425512 [Aspergillus homomorphus CBS 101889]|uniref:F-box domain-containing protein n=1 Tax=Aspergillus homomorphus (strain CBS 101889) TaxID=1450537 RepID=A0A395HVU2_ASPHC|nr:hypothetical protein BO97DRAFT_425512 [Aspergillus homomorphus CBS 101889]RAL11515.1 hypothetical protein BO97DRAFT_425512 [Aspergillus homomorphus CBS 101889]